MIRPVKILLSILILSANAFLSLIAQNFAVSDYRGELNIKLETIDEKRLDKGVEMLNEAVLVEFDALRMLESMSDTEKIEGISTRYNKMIKGMLDASELYGEGHELLYSVYDENCDKFRMEMKKMNHYASGMNKAKYYEQKGENTMKRARNIREYLADADKPEWIQYKMHEALELEKLAIRDKGRALQIYQDFPVEYNYGWDDDVTDDELLAFFNNPIINLPPEEVFKKKPVQESVEPEKDSIVYRVQIAAHTVPLEMEYIRTFYTGKDSVMEVVEGNWFKYQIGEFNNFTDANKLRSACRVPRAFVVAYYDGKKVTIKQALAVQQRNQ